MRLDKLGIKTMGGYRESAAAAVAKRTNNDGHVGEAATEILFRDFAIPVRSGRVGIFARELQIPFDSRVGADRQKKIERDAFPFEQNRPGRLKSSCEGSIENSGGHVLRLSKACVLAKNRGRAVPWS